MCHFGRSEKLMINYCPCRFSGQGLLVTRFLFIKVHYNLLEWSTDMKIEWRIIFYQVRKTKTTIIIFIISTLNIRTFWTMIYKNNINIFKLIIMIIVTIISIIIITCRTNWWYTFLGHYFQFKLGIIYYIQFKLWGTALVTYAKTNWL